MAARQFKIEFSKTYATEANAVKAVEKKFGNWENDLRYFIMPTPDGRFGVVFVGVSALQDHVHFHFNVIA